MSPSTPDEIIHSVIQAAINKEIDAQVFFLSAASRAIYLEISTLFKELAKEEEKHQKILEELPDPATLPESSPSIMGLEISLFPMDLKFNERVNYEELMIQAIEYEENCSKFYRTWEAVVRNPTLKKVFAFLAAEEAEHKYRLESIFNEKFFKTPTELIDNNK